MNKQKLSIIALLALTTLMISVSTTQAQTIQDSTMCYGYDSALQPLGVGSTVFQYTEKIGLWVQIQNPASVEYRVVWTDPDGNQFRSTAVDVVEKSGESWGILFDSINIAQTTAKNKLGVWTASLYIDHELKLDTEFQIIDYAQLIANVQSIQGQIKSIIDEKDSLLAQNAALKAQIDSLQASYTALQAQVGTSSGYQQLQDKYDALSADYTALQASQGTTRTMMYAAIVVALISVVVAVYFGAMKK